MKTGIVLYLTLNVCLQAQTVRPQVENERRVGVTAERRLGLDEALRMALANNLELEVERTNVQSTQQALQAAKGAFDTILRYTPGIETRGTPQPNALLGANGKLSERAITNNFSLVQATPVYGLSFFTDFDNSRNNSNNPFNALNPFFQSRLRVGFSAPLLRNRMVDPQRAEIVIRRKAADRAEVDLETRVTDVITRTIESYWDLASALEAARVARDGVNLAQEQYDRSKRQVEAGTLAPVELSAAEAELQRRVDTYVSAVGQITVAENVLKLLVAPNRGDAVWGERILPSSAPTQDVPEPALAGSLELALKKRPELRALALTQEAAKVQTRVAREQVRPQMNLVASYSAFGLAGSAVQGSNAFGQAFEVLGGRVNELSRIAGLPPLPPFNIGGSGVPAQLVGGYGQNLSNLFGGDYQAVSAGISFEWNPRNRTAQAQAAQAAIAERRLELSRQQIEQGIEAQVRSSIQGIQTAEQRIAAARASEKAAREKLDSEIRLFQTGESTNFLVLTRQNELLDSRRRLVEALLLLNRAITRYEQSVGRILETNQIRVQ